MSSQPATTGGTPVPARETPTASPSMSPPPLPSLTSTTLATSHPAVDSVTPGQSISEKDREKGLYPHRVILTSE